MSSRSSSSQSSSSLLFSSLDSRFSWRKALLSSISDDWSTGPPSRPFSTAVSIASQAPNNTASAPSDVAIGELGISSLWKRMGVTYPLLGAGKRGELLGRGERNDHDDWSECRDTGGDEGKWGVLVWGHFNMTPGCLVTTNTLWQTIGY